MVVEITLHIGWFTGILLVVLVGFSNSLYIMYRAGTGVVVDTSSACNILRYDWCVRPDLAKAVSCAEPIAKDCGAMSAKASWFALFTRGLASPPLASI